MTHATPLLKYRNLQIENFLFSTASIYLNATGFPLLLGIKIN